MAKKLGIKLEDILKLHNQGLYDQEIADIFGCERSNITIRLRKAGLPSRRSKINDKKLRDKISKSLIGRFYGENNPNYKGYTNEKTVARGLFKTISKEVMREANYTCVCCGKRGGNLETHHIKPFNIILSEFLSNEYDGNIQNIYQQLMNYQDFIDKNNLVVLCKQCHYDLHYTDNPELNPFRWGSATTISEESTSQAIGDGSAGELLKNSL